MSGEVKWSHDGDHMTVQLTDEKGELLATELFGSRLIAKVEGGYSYELVVLKKDGKSIEMVFKRIGEERRAFSEDNFLDINKLTDHVMAEIQRRIARE